MHSLYILVRKDEQYLGSLTMEVARLKDLQIGEEAEILGYAPCDPAYRNKLLSLGLTKATRIRLIQKAPLGDPVEIEVRGFRLSLRKDEADVILLRKLNGEDL
jgi:ferrous iron transport protein A